MVARSNFRIEALLNEDTTSTIRRCVNSKQDIISKESGPEGVVVLETEGTPQMMSPLLNNQTARRSVEELQYLNKLSIMQMQWNSAIAAGRLRHFANRPEQIAQNTVPVTASRPAATSEIRRLHSRHRVGDSTKSTMKKYRCDICDKTFSRSNTLITHKRIHTGEKPFKCEHCGRAFRQPGNLTRHRLTHTTVKPYVCVECDKAFNRASNLHTHMRTHNHHSSSSRPFVCPVCGKAFNQKVDLKMHAYSHGGQR